MKLKIDTNLTFSLGGGLAFNYLFWSEKLGLNLFIYSIFILIIYAVSKDFLKHKKLIVIAVTHAIAGLLVVANHSSLNIIIWFISLFVLVGYTHFPKLRSIFTALTAALLQFFTAPFGLIKKLSTIQIGGLHLKPVFKLIKYLVIPGFIMLLFCIIYSIANPVFASFITEFFEIANQLLKGIFTFFFSDIRINRLGFLLLGIVFSAGLFITFKNELEKNEAMAAENLVRVRRSKKEISVWTEIMTLLSGNLLSKKLALKTENTIAIISFSALNGLLLLLNCIDISTLWLGNLGSLNFSQALHGSTNALIVSIALAMLIILYFFNGNLNFYRKNKAIQYLAYAWILQNSFLILSVLLRDYHYIAMHGLTYKRIGVGIFSLLCFIGLLTVYLKVAKQKTLFYLFKTNGAIWYVLLLLSGLVNWDVFIVSYNIENRKTATLDVNYLMQLSDKTLPQLITHKELLKTVINSQNTKVIEYDLSTKFDKDLDSRIERFESNLKKSTWLSWNYRDWETSSYLNVNK